MMLFKCRFRVSPKLQKSRKSVRTYFAPSYDTLAENQLVLPSTDDQSLSQNHDTKPPVGVFLPRNRTTL